MLAPGAGSRLASVLAEQPRIFPVEQALRQLIDSKADRLPFPAAGSTLERWRSLAAVASHDLSLVKLFEGHTDALAILQELGADSSLPESRASRSWGTWCAEPPDARLEMRASGSGTAVTLHGTKAWCSGAHAVTHALVSCWDEDGRPRLAAVAIDQPGVAVTSDGWHAVGMASTRSVDVRFDGALAAAVGGPGDYVERPGFWQGGAGIAACWYGGAEGIAEMTRQRCGPKPDPHRLAHLGAIDVALAGAASVLRETAAWIDANPTASAQLQATRARLVCERAATDIVLYAGRALGAAPLCRDARFAQAMADLPVFIRQSHAERDLASLGDLLRNAPEPPWTL
ncbi:acyl-CoA dehydrogenase [Variovorax sp. RHLX14]|uniref:acyl-CoA dehydrogenase n=1 Tax=Variovorax sp. RHLX14 TaxID=1259731 RepID=UPI003F45B3DF